MAWTGHVVVAFPDPPSLGHIVDHQASELTGLVVNKLVDKITRNQKHFEFEYYYYNLIILTIYTDTEDNINKQIEN